jgi:ABC-type antimicrobial peptide transport system permease subunit
MLRIVVGALLGFIVAFVVALLLTGQFWPSMPYEVALPMLLAAGGLGGIAGGVGMYWRRSKTVRH